MSKTRKSEKKNENTNDIFSCLSPEDFNGHTEFFKLTPEKKLEWLSHAAAFVLESRKMRAAKRKSP